MKLEDSKRGDVLRGVIEKVSQEQLSLLNKTKNFNFDWELESKNQVFMVRLAGKKECLDQCRLLTYLRS